MNACECIDALAYTLPINSYRKNDMKEVNLLIRLLKSLLFSTDFVLEVSEVCFLSQLLNHHNNTLRYE